MPGSGKSTLAGSLREVLTKHGNWVSFLDGDQVRKRLNRDLGFSEADRTENLRRAAEIARLMAKAGSLVIVSFITPLESNRQMVREILDGHDYCECFVKCSLATCETRDPKGLYARARKGEIANMTGIDAPFEVSVTSEIIVDTENTQHPGCMAQLLRALRDKGIITVG
ncbi:MAG: adenylyl-sulfate kinase [Desulfarculaceae bacterium]|nr:adenylyl-sulfate kinase [Desulfarculaceae bacterium]MCF8049130.1 adenylyl-sulfate kinase [Desulfarculaceae bacterium]MCF8065197.1 adenylyl-sulfate kinase [Desulfarculaceae bacterium]MCF8122738.1 adenylyl-sulfate kinase [Desulfarculaceae bacterium]